MLLGITETRVAESPQGPRSSFINQGMPLYMFTDNFDAKYVYSVELITSEPPYIKA
jgi:hypothetical protein